jgi:hypothetical protein
MQLTLAASLAEGQYFDPIRRGRALAIAGRSAPVRQAAYNELLTRESHLRSLQTQWPALLQALHGEHEIASTLVNNLWSGVTFVFTFRSARAPHWNCAEVEEASRRQLDALPAYRSVISNVAARLAAVYPAPENALQVNKHYACFFLPFWWKHVLLRGVLDLVDSTLPKNDRQARLSRGPPARARARAAPGPGWPTSAGLPAPPSSPGLVPSLCAPTAHGRASLPAPTGCDASWLALRSRRPAPYAPPAAQRRPHSRIPGPATAICGEGRLPTHLWKQLRHRPSGQPSHVLLHHLQGLSWPHQSPLRMPFPSSPNEGIMPGVDPCWSAHPFGVVW